MYVVSCSKKKKLHNTERIYIITLFQYATDVTNVEVTVVHEKRIVLQIVLKVCLEEYLLGEEKKLILNI